MNFIQQNLEEAALILKEFSENKSNILAIKNAGELMLNSVQNGGKIISCGNGGSMSDAMHFAEELTGRFRGDRPGIPAIAISDSGYLSCTANDFGYDAVFERFVSTMGNEFDVLLAISTSGNSENVLRAAKVAHEKGMKVVGLTGKDGGKLSAFCDVEIRISHFGYADRIQEMHIKIIHSLVQYIETGLGNS